MKKNVFALALLVMVLLLSCTNEDDPTSKSTFSIQQQKVLKKSINNKTGNSNYLNGDFSFTKVLIGVSEIKFEKEFEMDDDNMEEEMKYKGAFQFDVLNASSSPAILPIDLKPGAYHELEFKVDKVLSTGNSIEISGSYDDGVSNYAFEFSSTMEEEFEIENKEGIDLILNETTNFVLMLRLEGLFHGVDFSQADIDEDDIIRINSNSNTELAAIIEGNFEGIMDFEHENNSDDHDKD